MSSSASTYANFVVGCGAMSLLAATTSRAAAEAGSATPTLLLRPARISAVSEQECRSVAVSATVRRLEPATSSASPTVLDTFTMPAAPMVPGATRVTSRPAAVLVATKVPQIAAVIRLLAAAVPHDDAVAQPVDLPGDVIVALHNGLLPGEAVRAAAAAAKGARAPLFVTAISAQAAYTTDKGRRSVEDGLGFEVVHAAAGETVLFAASADSETAVPEAAKSAALSLLPGPVRWASHEEGLCIQWRKLAVNVAINGLCAAEEVRRARERSGGVAAARDSDKVRNAFAVTGEHNRRALADLVASVWSVFQRRHASLLESAAGASLEASLCSLDGWVSQATKIAEVAGKNHCSTAKDVHEGRPGEIRSIFGELKLEHGCRGEAFDAVVGTLQERFGNFWN